jgi:hypothetical protein
VCHYFISQKKVVLETELYFMGAGEGIKSPIFKTDKFAALVRVFFLFEEFQKTNNKDKDAIRFAF